MIIDFDVQFLKRKHIMKKSILIMALAIAFTAPAFASADDITGDNTGAGRRAVNLFRY